MWLNHVFGGDVAKTLGVGEVFGVEAAKLFVMLAPNYMVKLGEQYVGIRNRDKNHDLENALVAAYEKTIERIEEDFIQIETINTPLYRRMMENFTGNIGDSTIIQEIIHDYFFDKVLHYFISDAQKQEFITGNKQLMLEAYLSEIFSKNDFQSVLLDQYTDSIDKELLLRFFKEKFLHYFPQAFTQELKNEEKAKTAYFKNLLELSLSRLSEIKSQSITLAAGQESIQSAITTLNSLAVRTNNDLAEIISGMAELKDIYPTLLSVIPDIQKIKEDVLRLKELMEEQNRWVPNLVLEEQEVNVDRTNIFDFKAQYMPFRGRGVELSFLFDFLDSENQFSWMMLKGAGGSGKSRLVQQLCLLSKDQGFLAGFYRIEQAMPPDDDRRIGKSLPLLIIIDYATSDIEKVTGLIRYFQEKIGTAKRYNNATNKIRLIVVDRDFKGNWDDATSDLRASYFGHYLALEVTNNDDDIRWHIIEEVIRKEIPSEAENKLASVNSVKSNIISALDDLDPLRRPLFAFFAGEALVFDPNGNLGNWTVQNLLKLHTTRLRRVRAKYKGYKKHEFHMDQLILVNCLCRSISNKDINILLKKYEGLPDSQRVAIRKSYPEISDQGIINGETVFFGLQPDILAGFYLLESFNELYEDDIENFEKAIALSWNTAPYGFWWTFSLFIEDFFAYEEIYKKTIELAIIETVITNTTENNIYGLGLLLLGIIIFYGDRREQEKKHGDEAKRYFEVLLNLRAQFNNDIRLSRFAVQSMLNLIAYSEDKSEVAYFVEIIEKQFPNENDESLEVLKAACLYNYSVRINNYRELLPIVSKLDDIYNKYALSEVVVTHLIIALSRTIELAETQVQVQDHFVRCRAVYKAGKQGTFDSTKYVQALYRYAIRQDLQSAYMDASAEIQELFTKYHIDEIASFLARLQYSAFLKFDKADAAQARELCSRLKFLYHQFPEHKDLALVYAMIIGDLAVMLQDPKDFESYYEEIGTIYGRFRGLKPLAVLFGQFVYALIKLLNNTSHIQPYANVLEFLIQDVGNEWMLVGTYGSVLAYITKVSMELETTDLAIQKLLQLQENNPGNETIAEMVTSVLSSVTSQNFTGERLNDATVILSKLSVQFPENFRIAFDFAAVLAMNLQMFPLNEKADSYIANIELLLEKFSVDEKIGSHLAGTLYTLSNNKNSSIAEKFAKKLDDLRRENPTSGALNFYWLMSKKEKLEKTSVKIDPISLIDDLSPIANTFVDDSDIAKLLGDIWLIVTTRNNDPDQIRSLITGFDEGFSHNPLTENLAETLVTMLCHLIEYANSAEMALNAIERMESVQQKYSSNLYILLYLCLGYLRIIYAVGDLKLKIYFAEKIFWVCRDFAQNADIAEMILLSIVHCYPLLEGEKKSHFAEIFDYFKNIILKNPTNCRQLFYKVSDRIEKKPVFEYVFQQSELLERIASEMPDDAEINLKFSLFLVFLITIGEDDQVSEVFIKFQNVYKRFVAIEPKFVILMSNMLVTMMVASSRSGSMFLTISHFEDLQMNATLLSDHPQIIKGLEMGREIITKLAENS